MRGLRLEAEGRGNDAGQLVAAKIRFDEQDFRTAQALEARVDPVETLATSTKLLAESNQERITAAEQNAERLSGQIGESALSPLARPTRPAAQASADRAQADVNAASERINAMDDYATYYKRSRSTSARAVRCCQPQRKRLIDEVGNQGGARR